jgi:hypothetical protein
MIPDAKVGAVAAALRAIYLPVAPYKHPATAGRGTLPDETTRFGEILQQPKLDAFPHIRRHPPKPHFVPSLAYTTPTRLPAPPDPTQNCLPQSTS